LSFATLTELLARHSAALHQDQKEVKQLSLHELANLAYTHHDIEQTTVNAYSGKGFAWEAGALDAFKVSYMAAQHSSSASQL